MNRFRNTAPTPTISTPTSKCPFAPRNGYSTEQGRREYLKSHHVSDLSKAQSLYADPDQSNQPLYYWQLYSLLGRRPIFELVTNFYTSIYADADDDVEWIWFREAFTNVGSKEHHIQAQAAYWIDAMGGGRVYHGGQHRLNFHHNMNAGHVMNAKGASRWMYHMRKTLVKYDFDQFGDVRILPCIVDFLKTKMKSYAKEHMWEFEERDFEFPLDDAEQHDDGDQEKHNVEETKEEKLHAIAEADDNEEGDEEKKE